MANPIITRRIKVIQAEKKRLLSLKKAERGDKLKNVEKTLQTLKRWNNETQ